MQTKLAITHHKCPSNKNFNGIGNSLQCTFHSRIFVTGKTADQALYAKLTEVAWNHQLKFETIIPMMGSFHIICNLLSIIGKLFHDAGFRDSAVESGIIDEGSIWRSF